MEKRIKQKGEIAPRVAPRLRLRTCVSLQLRTFPGFGHRTRKLTTAQ